MRIKSVTRAILIPIVRAEAHGSFERRENVTIMVAVMMININQIFTVRLVAMARLIPQNHQANGCSVLTSLYLLLL
jgi:hypothetical protein